MEAAYLTYAKCIKMMEPNMPHDIFIGVCSMKFAEKDGFTHEAMQYLVMAYHSHNQRIVFDDILFNSKILPFSNSSEAFEAMRGWGITPRDLAPTHDVPDSNFALSLEGLKICAEHIPKLKRAMDYAQCIINARKMYDNL